MLIQWIQTFLLRNYSDIIQGLVFALITIILFFKKASRKTQVIKFILSFFVAFQTADFISYILYQQVTSLFSLTGTLYDFLVATVCLLLPIFLMIDLYRKVIGIQGPVGTFIYTLFFNANCLAMLIAMTTMQRMLITVVLSLLLVFFFREEIQYIVEEKSMLRMDRRFQWTAMTFMILIGAEAELPRIVINGGVDDVTNQLTYAVAIVGSLLVLMFIIFMKFNFFAIMKYENYIRNHDDDRITNAKSLAYLLENGAIMVKNASVKHQELAIFYSNIDHFRDINILHGYDAGNNILKKTADYMIAEFPEGIIGRTSGTHFTGIVPLAGAMQKFASISRKIEELSIDESLILQIGVCPLKNLGTMDHHQVDYNNLAPIVDLAATALRYTSPKSPVKFYDEEMRKNEEIRLHVLAHIDQAIKENWLQNYYQPLVDIKQHKIISYEALSRWIDPIYGLLTPNQFIIPLENARMIYKVDLQVLCHYGQFLSKMHDLHQEVLPISFNISRTDLESGIDIYTEIQQIINTYHIPKSLIHVEITETAINGDSKLMKQALQQFHAMGLEVWMDDFGSGYSSLNVLKDYHFDVIKIDMEFMRKFDDRSKTIVRSICEMAQSLHIRTVAEGVETKEHYDFLKEVGCTYAQGYLFSKPVPENVILNNQLEIK